MDDLTPVELLRRLAGVTLEGVMFLDAVRLSEGDRPVGAVISEAEYVAHLPDGIDLAAAFARAADTGPMPVMRKSDKAISRTIDVRQTLLSAAPWHDDEAAGKLDWQGGQLMSFKIAVRAEGNARPREAMRALFGDDVAGQVDVARLRLNAVAPS